MISLSPRLQAILELLPHQMSRFFDVACDHALLAIAVKANRLADEVFATDLNADPLLRAQNNLEFYGLETELELLQINGLEGVNLRANDVIAIAGLGGNEIGDILRTCRLVKGIRFFIQCNWHWERLRKFMVASGFELIEDHIIEDRQRVYLLIEAVFSGKVNSIDEITAFVGPKLYERLLNRQVSRAEIAWLSYLQRVAKQKAGSRSNRDRYVYQELKTVMEDINANN